MFPAQKKGSLCHGIRKLSQISPGSVRQFRYFASNNSFPRFWGRRMKPPCRELCGSWKNKHSDSSLQAARKNMSFVPPTPQNSKSMEPYLNFLLDVSWVMCSCSRLSNTYAQARDQIPPKVKTSTKIYWGVTLTLKNLLLCPWERFRYKTCHFTPVGRFSRHTKTRVGMPVAAVVLTQCLRNVLKMISKICTK